MDTARLFEHLTLSSPFFLIAGPNTAQTSEHALKMGRCIKAVADDLGIVYVFKSSFDKANRTSASSYRGPGISDGLNILQAVKSTLGIPVLTDIHEPWQAEVAGQVADILQIPAFLCRQTDLLTAAAKTGKIIIIKKGQWCSASVVAASANKVRKAGNPHVLVCERGTNMGYHDLIVDTRNLAWMRQSGCPVVADITHSLQQPASQTIEVRPYVDFTCVRTRPTLLKKVVPLRLCVWAGYLHLMRSVTPPNARLHEQIEALLTMPVLECAGWWHLQWWATRTHPYHRESSGCGWRGRHLHGGPR